MRIYASGGRLRTMQVAGDAAVLAWCALWAWIGVAIHDLINSLAVPGRFLVDASDGIGDKAERLPSLLRPVEDALGSMAGGLRGAGDAQVEAVGDIALFLAVFVVVWPVVPVLVAHLFRRSLWVLATRGLARLEAGPGVEELLARRALVNQPLHRLAAVSSDPVGDIRHGNFGRLAQLEASRYGIRLRRHH